jgi:parallel beta-helix repeat protein
VMQALAIAEVRAGRLAAAIEDFGRVAGAPGSGRVAAAIYEALLGDGEVERAAAFAGSITEPADLVTLRLAEARLLFGDPKRPTFDPAAAAARRQAAAELAAKVADAALRDTTLLEVAGAYASLGEVAPVDRLAALASAAARPNFSAVKAGALARSGGREAAMAFVDALPQAARDQAAAQVSRALADGAQPIAAFDVAKLITDDRLRRATFRSNAEKQTRLQREREPDDQAAVRSRVEGISISSGQFLLKSAEIGRPKRLPELLATASETGRSVRASVPSVAPGNARVVPTGFSNFDEKFSYIRYLNSVDLNGGEDETLAQGQGTLFPQFIYLESGVFDLPTLKSRLRVLDTSSIAPIENNGRAYQINMPLLIGRDATLIVTSADVEELRLNTRAHAYIINSGRLFIVDATLTSWDPETGKPTPRTKRSWSEFNPFYAAWSDSETYFADARINALGYANGKSYGISISSGPANVVRATLNTMSRPTGVIVDSTFSDMYFAFYSYEADQFKLIGNEYLDNEIYAIDPHDRTTRLTIAYNTIYATRVKHGIIFSREVRNSAIFGNLSADNVGSGLVLDRASDDNIIAYNLAFRNAADGLTVYESSCNLVINNSFLDNRRDGVKLRNSWDVMVGQNLVSDNEGTGLNVYSARLEGTPEAAERDFQLDPYTQYANVTAVGNQISRNEKSALRGIAVSSMILARNRLTVDEKNLLKQSDFASLGPSLLALAGTGAALRDVCQPAKPPRACHFLADGYFGADLVAVLDRFDGAGHCANGVN